MGHFKIARDEFWGISGKYQNVSRLPRLKSLTLSGFEQMHDTLLEISTDRAKRMKQPTAIEAIMIDLLFLRKSL